MEREQVGTMMLRERLKKCWARCPRLHRSSVVVGLLVAGVYVLLAFPGEDVESGWSGTPVSQYIKYAHGWPWRWYDRWVGYDTSGPEIAVPTGYLGLSWLNSDAWLVFSRDVDAGEKYGTAGLDLAALSGDAGVGLLAVTLVAYLWEARRRRRRTVWQFTVRDFVALVAVIGLILGYCAHVQRSHARETRSRNALKTRGCTTHLDNLWMSSPLLYASSAMRLPEPAWLRRLVGADRTPDWFSHVDQVDMMSFSAGKAENVMPHLENLDHLERILIQDAHERPLPVEHFSRLSSLNELHIREYEPFDAETVEQLKTLKQLDLLSITYASSLSESARRDLEQALPNCEIVAYSDQ